MATGERKDPFAAFRFVVEIEGLAAAGFAEVGGLETEIATEEYREGGVNDFVHKLPNGAKQPNLTLQHGLTDSDALWKWQLDIVRGTVTRKTVRIMVLDSEGQEKVGWRCLEAYPTKWVGPALKADGNAVAIERLELAHKGIERV
jgi:phage tail-like protein